MNLQKEIDAFTSRLFMSSIPEEAAEHHEFLNTVMSISHEGLTVEEAKILLDSIDQVCILITTFYILCKANGEDQEMVAKELGKGIMRGLAYRAAQLNPSKHVLN